MSEGLDLPPKKRVQIVAPGQAVLEELAAPSPLETGDGNIGATDIVLQTAYTLISPGTELAQGHFFRPDQVPLSRHRRFPRHPGYAAVGTVVAVGSEVEGVRAGDLLFAHTPHESWSRFDARECVWAPLPEALADPERMMLAPFARLATVGMTAITLTKARPGQWVGVVGLGLVGQLAAQCALASGYRVIAMDLSPGRRAIAEACGLPCVLDPTEASLAGVVEEMTDGKGIDLGIETSGTAQGLATALELARNGGEVYLTGAAWLERPDSPAPESLMRPIFFKYLTVRSGWEWQLPKFPTELASCSIQESTTLALDQIARGLLRPEPLLTDVARPEDIQSAYDGLAERPETSLGVVIDWRNSISPSVGS